MKDMFTQIKNRKGVSPMIAYIMLVSFVIVLGVLVYNWMRTYVPQDELKCPGDVSLFIESYSCGDGGLNVTIKNNGKFSLGGFFIYASTSPGQNLANKDLSPYSVIESPFISQTGGVQLGSDINSNSFAPNQEEIKQFNFSSGGFNIYSIEIVPIRWENQGRRRELVSCTESKIEEIISC